MEEEKKDIFKEEIEEIIPLSKNSKLKGTFNFILEILKTVVISLAIILPIRYFLIQPFMVDGASMQPNFHNREYLIIDEISYRFTEPNRGDVIVFKNPENTKEFYIKRAIGLPKENIRIKDGKVFIKRVGDKNYSELEESDYLPEDFKTFSYSKDIELKSDEYFVLGDNRSNSKDSRMIGPINDSLIIGKAWLRGFPLNKLSVFDSSEFNFGLK